MANSSSTDLDPRDPNLGTLTRILDTYCLPRYAELLSRDAGRQVSFGDHADLADVTATKTYSALTTVPTLINGEEVATMYVLLLRPGDGTGDEKTYKNGELWVPEQYRHEDRPERVNPRSKTGNMERGTKTTIVEGLLPFFSIAGTASTGFRRYQDRVCLEELGIEKRGGEPVLRDGKPALTKIANLGATPGQYCTFMGNSAPWGPSMYITVGPVLDGPDKGKRFGDPHTIYSPQLILENGTLEGLAVETAQLVGFLAVTDTENPLLEVLLKNVEMPQNYRL